LAEQNISEGKTMAKKRHLATPEALLTRVNAIVHSGISGMSKEEFEEFDRKSKETIAKIKARSNDCEEPIGIDSGRTEVLHA